MIAVEHVDIKGKGLGIGRQGFGVGAGSLLFFFETPVVISKPNEEHQIVLQVANRFRGSLGFRV